MRFRTMRWRSLMAAWLQYPPQFVEVVMLLLSLTMLLLWWLISGWQYLLLCLCYLVGAIASILVRETIHPSPHTMQIRWTALVSLVLLLTLSGIYINQVLHAAGLTSL